MNADLAADTQYVTCFDFQSDYCEIEHADLPAAMKLRAELASSKLVTSLGTWSVRKGELL